VEVEVEVEVEVQHGRQQHDTFLDEHVAPSDGLLKLVLFPIILGQEVAVAAAHVLEAFTWKAGVTWRSRLGQASYCLWSLRSCGSL
jgi:hypothetical protein